MLADGSGAQSGLDHENSYCLEVLGLEDGDTEECMDERLLNEAKALGVDFEQLSPPKTQSTCTSSSGPTRRSESINSRASQSTGLTSNLSGISNHHRYPHGRRSSRVSLSFRDYDNFLARGTANGRTSMSFSPPATPSHSTFSLPLYSPEASPKRHSRMIRGLSMLRLHKSDSNTGDWCPHCPQDLLSQRRAVHKMPCGHKLCTTALRSTIKSATESKIGAVPSCCGIPISGTVVENVMTIQEQDALLDKLEQWDEASSIAPSLTSNRRGSVISSRPSPASRTASNDSKADSVAMQALGDLGKVQERRDFKELRIEQAESRDRFLAWIQKQRTELEAGHELARNDMKVQHESAIEDLLEHHGNAMAEAEDKQVKAEADLRELHSQEKRDNATALKHLEAYCAGTYGNGEEHNRPVTDQGRLELEKTRKNRDTMDAKHESAINVLRGEQGRRMKLREQRQDRESQELRRSQRKEELELERACTGEVHKLDDLVAEKRRKLRARWHLQTAIFTKRLESETGIVVRGRLPSVEWQSDMFPPSPPSPPVGKLPEGISTGFAVSGKV